MNYPQAFVLVNKSAELPCLEVLQSLLGSTTTHDVYVQGITKEDKDLENTIRSMMMFSGYLDPKPNTPMRCVIASTTNVSGLDKEPLTNQIRHIFWIDSVKHLKNIEFISSAVAIMYAIVDKLDEAAELHESLATFVQQVGKKPESFVPRSTSYFETMMDQATSDIEKLLRTITQNGTRTNMRRRKDLERLEGSQQAA
jgi:hypothetical protein